jgi:hypothetical protein
LTGQKLLALKERSGFRLLANWLFAEGFDARQAKLFQVVARSQNSR